MSTDEYDVIVVGLGPGGEHAATELAKAGLSVLGVDERLVGGECPYFGCVPSKMMIRAADALAEGRRIPGLAGSAEVRPDWGQVADRIRDEATDDWDDAVAVKRLEDAGVTFVRGHGRLAGDRTVAVGDSTYTATKGVVLNTGTAPGVPPVDGLADTPFWTNRDVVRITRVPASLVVIGGGAVGVELAQALHRFGVDVTIVEMADRLLAAEEPESSALIEKVLAQEGIRVRTGASIGRVDHADGTFSVDLGEETLTAEKLLVAAGRRPNLADIGLDTVGLDPDARSLETDERMRVQEGLWAIGDITGKGAFTHMSMYQADVVIRDLTGADGPWADYRAVSRVTFSDPEVGSVGMTEKQARDAGHDVAVGHTDLASSSRGWIARAEGLVKLVADTREGVLVGATAVGPSGGEILSMLVTAIHARVPIDTLTGMHFAYPTFHRAVETALKDLS